MKNPVLKGFFPDPSVCRVGTDYYLVCSSFEFFPGVPVFHSTDLENWTQIGNVLDRESQLPLHGVGASYGIWAPTIRYWNGKFYMITTRFGNGTHTFFVTAENPAGPWSDPVYIDLPRGAIDPSLFFDDDGACYLTVNDNRQWRIDPENGALLSEMRRVWPGTGGGYAEAPHLYRIGEYYYLLDAEGGTAHCHFAAIARSRSPWGPFEPCPHNPILTARGVDRSNVQCCGHGDLIDDVAGNWFMVFLGIREAPVAFPRVHHAGRETFLAPVRWENGWPVVNNGEIILPGAPEALCIEDDFSTRNPAWLHLRNPSPGAVSFAKNNLVLQGNGGTLDDKAGNPTVLLHRFPDTRFTFRAEISGHSDTAGLTLFMNEGHHYDFFPADGAGIWVLRRRVGDLEDSCFISVSGKTAGAGIEVTPIDFTFFTFDEAKTRTAEMKVLARYLSVEVAGGFTGLLAGFFADGAGGLSIHSAEFRTPKGE